VRPKISKKEPENGPVEVTEPGGKIFQRGGKNAMRRGKRSGEQEGSQLVVLEKDIDPATKTGGKAFRFDSIFSIMRISYLGEKEKAYDRLSWAKTSR